ncbi:MAG: class I SAM-dependent methyltransferase [Thermodesulfobacteriota bacterium]
MNRSIHPSSYVDPAGTIFEAEDQIYRGIRSEFAEFYSDLLKNSVIRQMLGQTIVETEIDTSVLPDIKGYDLILRHRRLSPLSFCYEWPALMLKDAALLTLDICINLLPERIVLQDAYPWNILFDSTRPILVDFTSIVPQDKNLPWVAYHQFCQFFLFPLIISCYLPSKVRRLLLMDYLGGIGDYELLQMMPKKAVVRMPWIITRILVPRAILAITKWLKIENKIIDLSAELSPEKEARLRFFKSLRKNVTAIPVRIRKTLWSQYYTNIESFFGKSEFNPKQAAVASILEKIGPKTVVDIGCNRGGYAILAAQRGAKVIAFDTDEDSVAFLYETAKEKQLPILPLVMDILNPSPGCGWRTQQFAAAPPRFRSEMALALALVHHLAITQRQTFDRIVLALADYAEKWLLTEFIPLDDPRVRELMATHRREMDWYSLENYLEALSGSFNGIDTFPSHPEGRTLILCHK